MGNHNDEAIPRTDGLADREPGEIVLRAEAAVAPRTEMPGSLAYHRHSVDASGERRHGMDGMRVSLALALLGLVICICLVSGPIRGPRRLSQAALTMATNHLRVIEGSIAMFRRDTGRFPSTAEGLNALITEPPNTKNWLGPYQNPIPVDPWGTPYQYRFRGAGNSVAFDLSSAGPDRKFGTGDDIVRRAQNGKP